MQLIGCENMRGIPFCIPLFLHSIFPGIMPSICANCQKATPTPKPEGLQKDYPGTKEAEGEQYKLFPSYYAAIA